MIRYYGFLTNPKRGTLLSKVYGALGMKVKDKPHKPGFASLMKQFTNMGPYQYVLCGAQIIFNSTEAGIRAERLLGMRCQQFATERWLRQAA